MFVFSVECDLHGNRDVSVLNLRYPIGFTQCLALGKGSLYICKINCWMNVAIRSLLAKVQEAVNYSEERAELGAKKSRFTFCRYHHPPYASLLPPLRWASPWSHYDVENLLIFERKRSVGEDMGIADIHGGFMFRLCPHIDDLGNVT